MEQNLRLKSKKSRKASKLHKDARELIKEVFPLETFYEELTLVGSQTAKNKVLYADFLSARMRLIIEVHGKQHYEYTPHYHGTRKAFGAHKRRDSIKKEWAELNSFVLVELPYNESWEEWEQRIRNWNSI